MRATTLLRNLLDLKQTRVTGFELTPAGLIADVAPTTRRARCGACGAQCRSWKDRRTRMWRHLEFAGMRVELRYAIRRANCIRCGVQTELVPWADRGSPFTRDFEDTVALLAQKTDKTTVKELMAVSWATVGNIVGRVVERRGVEDPLDELTHIGIDEISYKKHHNYLTVVVDHRQARVVWIGKGRRKETVTSFFDDLGAERTKKLKVVTIDMAESYVQAVAERAPQAELVFDRFHVQRLAQDAVDQVRRDETRKIAGTDEAKAIKGTRWALQKCPWNLTTGEKQRLADATRTNAAIYRAYLLKESLCDILDRRQPGVAREKLAEWCGWASRSQLSPFTRVAKTIKRHTEGIVGYIRTRLSNGRVEGMNRKIRTVTARAFGFHDDSSLAAMIFLVCGGIQIPPVRHFPTLR